MHKELALLIAAAGGRTLALFTSRRATEEAAAALAPDLPYRLLLQGELPKGRLLEAFAEDETSCLFATLGFWQGVDIPGPGPLLGDPGPAALPRPDDPLLQARRARAGSRAFSVVDLPRAATLLAQGSGRLIRTAEGPRRGRRARLRLATASYRTFCWPRFRRCGERWNQRGPRGIPAGGPGPLSRAVKPWPSRQTVASPFYGGHRRQHP